VRRAFLLALFVLSGCGERQGEASGSGTAPDINQIERLSTPKEETADPQAGARLEPLLPDDIALLGDAGPICAFRSEEAVLLAASASDAIVRQSGQILHPVHSSPMGPSGGFFEDRSLSISIGRTEASSPSAPPRASGPARMTVTERRSKAQIDLVGGWTCRD
jgi:hypothetical protein